MANKYINKCATSLVMMEMQMKTSLRFHLPQSERLSSRKQMRAAGMGDGVLSQGTRPRFQTLVPS
jgi:hypothetical protein